MFLSAKNDNEILNNLTNKEKIFSGESYISLICMGIVIILSFVIFFVFRKKDPTKPEKGFALIVCLIVEKLDGMVRGLMGKKYDGFGGYMLGLASYMVFCFIFSFLGFPNPFGVLTSTLIIGLCTFLLIHGNAIRANKLSYFHRYIEPFPVLLPINLLSMWAPLLSLSLRLFGNIIAGGTIMTIIYWALGGVSGNIFGFIKFGCVIIPPFITPVFHAYFDVFSALIQILIFMMLTMIFVSQEDLDPEFQ